MVCPLTTFRLLTCKLTNVLLRCMLVKPGKGSFAFRVLCYLFMLPGSLCRENMFSLFLCRAMHDSARSKTFNTVSQIRTDSTQLRQHQHLIIHSTAWTSRQALLRKSNTFQQQRHLINILRCRAWRLNIDEKDLLLDSRQQATTGRSLQREHST